MPEGSDIRNSVKDIISIIDKNRLYRGKGGEIMRGGVCHLIKAMAIAKLQFSNEADRFYLFEQL